ncbi:MAG: glycoside hydrolase family 3 C-terminal domain-containing protein [Lachnospiraceae bacterium]|nr:glycoside hydrolase family 3 C-terminal domain-containing protein [Lachnospiraceae bacterium]
MIKKEYTEEYRKRAKELISKMTLEEKVYQLRHPAPAIPRLGLKAYNYWNEAIHGVARSGVATVFPQAIGMAASFDEELIGRVADRISTEGRAKFAAQDEYDDRDIYKGLTFWAPNINIFRDPRWGRGHETYGEDPYLTSRLGVSFVKGIQGKDDRYLKAAACAKHFAVHSGPEAVRHSFDAKATKQDMRETYLPAFKALVEEAGVETVMGAYNRTNGEPCCGSKTLLIDILRKEWGFDGHVTSDCWAIKDFNEGHHVTATPAESVAMAVNNGCDLNCGDLFAYLLQAVEEGLVTEDKIDNALENVLTTRFKLGLFDEGGAAPYAGITYKDVDTDEARALNLEIAGSCVTMLKNDGALPLDASKIRTIGVIGPNADSRNALVGNYQGTSSEYVTVLEGIREEANPAGIRIFASEGCHLYKEKTEGLAQAGDRLSEVKAVCANSDLVIAVMGLDATLEGEEGDTGNEYGSGDKPNLKFPGMQQKVMDTIAASGKPYILVVLSGSALALDKEADRANAILQGWYPGAQGGRAIARILFGKLSPEGKLPVTFYSEKNTLPDFEDYSMKGRTYRYMTEKPLYPFGFGLSYTDFDEKIDAIKVNGSGTSGSSAAFKAGDRLDIDVSVANKGKMDGGVTVQVYVESGINGAPIRQLKGLKKLHVAAGVTAHTTITLDESAFAIFDENGEAKLNPGTYKVYVGDAQPDERSRELTGWEICSFEVKI